MAEVGLVASLLGISTFGIQLTTTLYTFGSTASSAREQTDYIARHVTLYSDVLELLAQRIDDDEPIHSRKALDLVCGIYDQSCDLFDNIRDLLPDRADKMSFIEKIKWNFKKTKVDLLVSEIEYLKSTVNLLVSVLYAGKKIRTHYRKRKSKRAEKDAKTQFARAQNAVVEQVNATNLKENMQAKVEEDEQDTVGEATGIGSDQKSTAIIKHAPPILHLVNNTAIVQFRHSLEQAKSSSEERGLVISNSMNLLNDLLYQWTTLAEDSTTAAAAADKAEPSTRVTNEQTPKEGSDTAKEPTRDAHDVWRDNYMESQRRVEELEAELSRMKTAAETKRETGTPAPGDGRKSADGRTRQAYTDGAVESNLLGMNDAEKPSVPLVKKGEEKVVDKAVDDHYDWGDWGTSKKSKKSKKLGAAGFDFNEDLSPPPPPPAALPNKAEDDDWAWGTWDTSKKSRKLGAAGFDFDEDLPPPPPAAAPNKAEDDDWAWGPSKKSKKKAGLAGFDFDEDITPPPPAAPPDKAEDDIWGSWGPSKKSKKKKAGFNFDEEIPPPPPAAPPNNAEDDSWGTWGLPKKSKKKKTELFDFDEDLLLNPPAAPPEKAEDNPWGSWGNAWGTSKKSKKTGAAGSKFSEINHPDDLSVPSPNKEKEEKVDDKADDDLWGTWGTSKKPKKKTTTGAGDFTSLHPNEPIIAQSAPTPTESRHAGGSSPYTPYMREESPPRTTKPQFPSTTSTKYRIVDSPSEDDRRENRVRPARYARYADRSRDRDPPVIDPRQPVERERIIERPRVDATRYSKSTPVVPRRAMTTVYEDRSSSQPLRESHPAGRQPATSGQSPYYSTQSYNIAPRSQANSTRKPSKGATLMQDFSDSDWDSDVDTNEETRRRHRRKKPPRHIY